MFATQELGYPTLNGYSGNSVPGYDSTHSCIAFVWQLKAYDEWSKRHAQPPLKAYSINPFEISMEPCNLSVEHVLKIAMTGGPHLDKEAAKHIVLSNAHLERVGAALRLTVDITNHSPQVVHGFTKNPLRLSWRPAVQSGDRRLGWDTRADIVEDIPPGATQVLTFSIGPESYVPGSKLELSFVVEGKFWGYDIGVPPVEVTVPLRKH